MDQISDVRELMRRLRLKAPGTAKVISRKARAAKVIVTPLKFEKGQAQLGEACVWFELPIRISGLANRREHHRVKSARAGDHVALAKNATRSCLNVVGPIAPPYVVTLTRIVGPRGRNLDAHDNLRDGFKSIVDGIAEALGVDDGDTARIRFEYEQEPGADWGIHVDISGRVLEAAK